LIIVNSIELYIAALFNPIFMQSSINNLLPDEVIMNKIYLIRGKKVMLDRDLAELYNVETRSLKQAVKRNMVRFPEDFMFKMNEEEFQNWRSQIVISNSDRMGLRHPPFCFTEQGVTMLSCLLNSETAIHVNIQIIRIFTKMKEMLLTHKEILMQLEQLEREVSQNNSDIRQIFEVLRSLLDYPEQERTPIGFKQKS